MPTLSSPPARDQRHALVLRAVLAGVRPLVRLLVRSGVTYPAFAAALKAEFVGAANAEIDAQGMKRTDSAVTLLSGVHRKDVRDLSRPQARAALPSTAHTPHGLVGQVVLRWMHDRAWSPRGKPRVLPRAATAARDGKRASSARSASDNDTFDALVAGVSRDVRPRAILDEMLRLGVVSETEQGIRLDQQVLTPRAGFDAMCDVMAMNLHDHAAAAASNVHDDRNLLEQSIYVDEITADSARALHRVATKAWRRAFDTVAEAARERVDHDRDHAPPEQRRERARFGVYYFHGPEEDSTTEVA
jgi:hypothetical protein